MNKYNIYRIKKDKEEALVEKLESVGLESVCAIEAGEFLLNFFFSREPDEVDIWWVETYGGFLKGIEPPKNRIYFGLLILSSEDKCYAVSLGKSHFYLRQFCDSDFGLNLAERIIDQDNLKIKSSKFYKSRKSKIITTYHDGIEIDYDSGESMHFLKAKTIEANTWGKTASFGSSVQFNLDTLPTELPGFLTRIEQELAKPPLFSLPKVDVVLDEAKIEELNQKLANAILASEKDSEVGVDEFTVSGVNFIFSDADEYSLCLKGHSRDKVKVESLSIENLLRFVQDTRINLHETLDDIQVHVHREYGRDYSQPLKFYLDFIDDEERHCLIDGVWHKFNLSYLEYLKHEVDVLDVEYNEAYDIERGANEDAFNKARAENDGFINYDKELTSLDGKYRVEKMDLYKENDLFFVKIGTPQKLSYVIDQAITTVKILQNRESVIEIDGVEVPVKRICIWIILDRREKLNKLSDINSLIFHMKLVEWKKIVLDAGYQPKVFMNYLI
jgi:uncharacterized protein (TIGR04141 family)